jgi:hypothetical protein
VTAITRAVWSRFVLVFSSNLDHRSTPVRSPVRPSRWAFETIRKPYETFPVRRPPSCPRLPRPASTAPAGLPSRWSPRRRQRATSRCGRYLLRSGPSAGCLRVTYSEQSRPAGPALTWRTAAVLPDMARSGNHDKTLWPVRRQRPRHVPWGRPARRTSVLRRPATQTPKAASKRCQFAGLSPESDSPAPRTRSISCRRRRPRVAGRRP